MPVQRVAGSGVESAPIEVEDGDNKSKQQMQTTIRRGEKSTISFEVGGGPPKKQYAVICVPKRV